MTIHYIPQRDITADEVRLIVGEIERTNAHVTQAWYDAQTPEVQRHFIIEEPTNANDA